MQEEDVGIHEKIPYRSGINTVDATSMHLPTVELACGWTWCYLHQWFSKCSPEPTASLSTGKLLDMKIFELHPGLGIRSYGAGPGNLRF